MFLLASLASDFQQTRLHMQGCERSRAAGRSLYSVTDTYYVMVGK